MKYMGSKARIAKYIIPIIQGKIDETGFDYIEPFAGGMNIIDKINSNHKTASDLNKYLIALFIHIQNGGQLINEVSRELYSEVRNNYKHGNYEDWYVGNIGFLASYNGRWFDGGFAKAGYEKTKSGYRYRDYYRESVNNLLKQSDCINDIHFQCKDYRELTPTNCVIYSDPPYENTKNYANSTGFDHAEFWDVMRKWTQNNIVIISEENAPDDFICIWQHDINRSINVNNKKQSIEKLFMHKSQVSIQ